MSAISDRESEQATMPLRADPAIMPEWATANRIPEQQLRQFYDPTDRFIGLPTQEFIEWVAGTRLTTEVAGIGTVTPHEAILAESTHAFIRKPKEIIPGIPLPIPARRQEDIISRAGHQAAKIALSVLDTAEGVEKEWQERTGRLPEVVWRPLPSRMLLTGKILAAVAHAERKRDNEQPYFRHPDEVASIMTASWRKQKFESGPYLDLVRFMIYADDAYEDTIDPHGIYLKKPLIVTPLVVQKLLRWQAIPEADYAAEAVLQLTRTRDADDNRLRYADYIRRGLSKSGALFALPKAAAIQRNVTIDPSTEPIEAGDRRTWEKFRKKGRYLDAAVQLLIGTDAEEYSWVMHSIFAATKDEIQHIQQEKYPVHPILITKAVEKHLRFRLG